MSAPSADPSGQLTFALSRNRRLLKDQANASVEITGASDKAILQLIAKNEPFPAGDLEIGSIHVKGSLASDQIVFASDRGNVGFSATASALAGIGVYRSSASVLAALTFNAETQENLTNGLTLPKTDAELFLLFRWGYDVSAAVKGALALGTGGAIRFGVKAGREAGYAIVRRFREGVNSRDALLATVQSWCLPRQVTRAADLDPGTWIIAEVNGSLQANIGVSLGQDFSWIRKTGLGTLSGDIGLRIQLGLDAALNLFASGKYAVV